MAAFVTSFIAPSLLNAKSMDNPPCGSTVTSKHIIHPINVNINTIYFFISVVFLASFVLVELGKGGRNEPTAIVEEWCEARNAEK
jgi:hypothetical protein